jgi:hypothetical protein
MHPDLPQEQAYFDRALALRDRQHAVLEQAPSLSAHPKALLELRRRVSGLGVVDPDEAVAFGRIDAGGQRWYIGKGAIWDDDNDPRSRGPRRAARVPLPGQPDPGDRGDRVP